MSHTQTMSGIGKAPGPAGEGGGSAVFPAVANAGIIHDLGNLIQIASSAVNIVARNPSVHTADLEPVLAGARTSLERAGALVRQTMIAASERATAFAPVSVAACLAEIEVLVQVTWDEGIRLEVEAALDLPDVTCDPLALQNAVLNLLLNARDAMPGGGVISVRAETIALEAGLGIEIQVVDRGIGMTPDTVARALDPFFTTKCDGLGGIGLPMVERFMRDSGGRVHINSEYGVGTTVTLQLPATPGAKP